MTPAAYRPIICFSRTASCKSCASGRSQPFYRLWRSNIYATASRSGQRTAFRTEFVVAMVQDTMRVYLGAFPAAQVARSLRNRPPHQRVSTAQARMTRNNVVCMQPDAAAHNSWLRSSRECGISALNEPDPAPRLGVPVPFGSTQPSHGCVRDTDQLVELPLIGITDSAAQKTLVVNTYDRAVSCTLVRTLARVQHMTPCRAT